MIDHMIKKNEIEDQNSKKKKLHKEPKNDFLLWQKQILK